MSPEDMAFERTSEKHLDTEKVPSEALGCLAHKKLTLAVTEIQMAASSLVSTLRKRPVSS